MRKPSPIFRIIEIIVFLGFCFAIVKLATGWPA